MGRVGRWLTTQSGGGEGCDAGPAFGPTRRSSACAPPPSSPHWQHRRERVFASAHHTEQPAAAAMAAAAGRLRRARLVPKRASVRACMWFVCERTKQMSEGQVPLGLALRSGVGRRRGGAGPRARRTQSGAAASRLLSRLCALLPRLRAPVGRSAWPCRARSSPALCKARRCAASRYVSHVPPSSVFVFPAVSALACAIIISGAVLISSRPNEFF